MRQKCLLLIWTAICMAILCIGCGKQSGLNDETTPLVTVSPDNLACFDLIHNEVSEKELHAFLDSWPSLVALNEKFPIECFRYSTVPVWEYLIWATYRTDAGWTIVYFDDEMNYSSYSAIQMQSKAELLEQVTVGMPVEEVEALDPAGDYGFKYSNKKWVSYHYTEDGKEYFIAYDSSFKVTEIKCVVL